MQIDQSDQTAEVEGAEEEVTDPLAGEELFEVPEDLADESDTEAPAGTPEADSPTKGPPAPESAATQSRDEKGRFDEKQRDLQATPTGQPPERAESGSAPKLPTTDEQAPTEPELEFSFRADGRQITIPGSKVNSEGLFVPRDKVAELQRLASRGAVYEGSFRQRLEDSAKEVAKTRSEVHGEVEQAKHILAFWADIADRQASGEPALEDWLDDFQKNRVRLEADATLAEAKALREGRAFEPERVEGFDEDEDQYGVESYASAQQIEELQNGLSTELGERIQKALVAEGIRGLTASEISSIQESMMQADEIDRYFQYARDDIPQHGITKGQIVAMDAQITQRLKFMSKLILGARQQTQALSAAEEANRKKGAAVGNKIPPTVQTGANSVPKAGTAVPKFKNKEEMNAWFDAQDPLA